MRRVFVFGLLLLLCQMAHCGVVVGDTIPKVRDSISARDGIVFPVRKVGIQEMYDFRSGYLVTSIEAYRRIVHHAFMVDINADNPFQQSRELGLYSKVGYTYFAKSKMGGWGLYVGWDGGQYPHGGWSGVWNYYLFGAEYELFRSSGRLYHFRLTNLIYADKDYGFFPLGWFPAMFSFDWDVPRLLGVNGLTFCGKFDLWFGEYVWVDSSGLYDYFGFGLPFRLEPQLWYNFGSSRGEHNDNALFNREGLGVFLKLRINYNNPGGWHSGNTYYKNADLNLTYCLGVRMDL